MFIAVVIVILRYKNSSSPVGANGRDKASIAVKNEIVAYLLLLLWLSLMQNGVKAAVLPYAIPNDTDLLQAVTTAGLCVDPVIFTRSHGMTVHSVLFTTVVVCP